MHLSGRYQWYWLSISMGIFVTALLFFLAVVGVVMGIFGSLATIQDRTQWPVIPAGWFIAGAMAFFGVWSARRLRRSVRWFEFDGDRLRYQVVGSQREYSYPPSDLIEIRLRTWGGDRGYQPHFGYILFFRDKNWAFITDAVENVMELVSALTGDAPKPSLKHRLLWGTVFERQTDTESGPQSAAHATRIDSLEQSLMPAGAPASAANRAPPHEGLRCRAD